MKTTLGFFLYMTITLLSMNAFAEPGRSAWQEDYGGEPNEWNDPTVASKARDEKLRWLYEKLFTEDIRTSQPVDVWRTFQVHLQDTLQVFPDPSAIQQIHLAPLAPVQGKITYVGFVQKKYLYEVYQDDQGTIVLKVKVHLKNPTEEDRLRFAEKMKAAEDLWNLHRVPVDFVYRFKFEIVKTASEAPFSVIIKDSTRGPYDTFWSRDWTAGTVAHELGHMMGLGDEYQPLGKAYGCYIPSLMCSSSKGVPQLHHYYFILRRLLKPVADASTHIPRSQE